MRGEQSVKKKQDMQQIAGMLILNGTLTECPGLVHGKMGIAVSFFHYALYTRDNIYFFENNVFLTKEDILSTSITMKDFFSRQAMNLYDFGKINIMPNGDVYANLNHPELGNIYTDNIYEIVHKEVEEGKSWFRIRNQAPCNDCIYQWLCPPPSNYDIAIGRPNLCHVKTE